MLSIKKYFFSERTALILLVVAVLLLVVFVITIKNNGDIGSLTGGVVASIIYVANAILLYLTLKAQNEGIRNQKDIARQEHFETTLYNLLDNYINQLYRINFNVRVMQNPPNEEWIAVTGHSFISFAKQQLIELKQYYTSPLYVSRYDASRDIDGYYYKKEEKYDDELRLRYLANIYCITHQRFDEYKEKIMSNEMTPLQVCYLEFYHRWGCYYNQYIRIVKTIIAYIKNNRNILPATDYMSIFCSYLSIEEQRFLNYHASIDQEFADILHGTILEVEISNITK